MNSRSLPSSLFCLFSILLLVSCLPADVLWGDVGVGTIEPYPQLGNSLVTEQPQLPTNTFTQSQTPAATDVTEGADYRLWISPAVPPSLVQEAEKWGLTRTEDQADAEVLIDTSQQPPTGIGSSALWIYALVAPFPTVPDNVSLEEIRTSWMGIPSGEFSGSPIWMDAATQAAFSTLWGEPAPGAVKVVPSRDLLESAWAAQPSWAIVPFEALEPRWKVLSVDGMSPIDEDFDPTGYPLTMTFSLMTTLPVEDYPLPAINRDPSALTVLVMTGVTALVRATAHAMEVHGVLFPAQDILDWLVSADLTHISNEVAFAEDCPYPDPSYTVGLPTFCSDERYIELLEYIGTDIVELTGNHIQDWGSEAALLTLDMYNQRGWYHYGGGADLDDARQAAVVEHNGNRLAFLGCNSVGPGFAWASESQPGSSPCDFRWLESEVFRLRHEGYIPIVTFQHIEYYNLDLHLDQQSDFRAMVDAGALLVSGSQSHTAQGIEFYRGGFIHYGLGNLFFDQMDDISTRQEFIDRHVFYGGRHISVELLTAMLEDYARPRPMTAEERTALLGTVFESGLWFSAP